MRVLHVSNVYSSIEGGGQGLAVSLLAAAQAPFADVTVFTTDRSASLENDRHAHGFSVKDFHSFGRWNFSLDFMMQVRRRVREFDIVHIHGLWNFPGSITGLACMASDKPYLLTPHGTLNEWAVGYHFYKKLPYWLLLDQRVVHSVRRLHFTSQEERIQAERWIKKTRFEVVPLGLDLQPFLKIIEVGKFREVHKILPNTPLILFLGRIHPIKGLENLIRAMSSIKKHLNSPILILAGEGASSYVGSLRLLVDQLGLEQNVKFIGNISGQAKLELLRDSDVCILPSHSENFGFAAIEAMAAGCPLVISRGVNIARDLEIADAAWLAFPEPEDLAKAVVSALTDLELRKKRVDNAKVLVHSRYEVSIFAREMLRIYEQVLNMPLTVKP